MTGFSNVQFDLPSLQFGSLKTTLLYSLMRNVSTSTYRFRGTVPERRRVWTWLHPRLTVPSDRPDVGIPELRFQLGRATPPLAPWKSWQQTCCPRTHVNRLSTT